MSLQQAKEHAQNVDAVAALAINDTVAVMATLEGEPVPRQGFVLREVMPDIAEQYAALAGDLSVNFYEELRTEAEAPTAYTPTVANIGLLEKVQGAVSYSLAQTTAGAEWAAVTAVLAGNVQKLVAQVDRSTLAFNVVTDPDGTLYQRVPGANACAFCRTMASVARPTDSDYTHFHSFCRCTSLPIFQGQERVEVPGEKQTREAYDLANKELLRRREAVGYYNMRSRQAAKAYPDLTLTTKNHLRLMRDITGWS